MFNAGLVQPDRGVLGIGGTSIQGKLIQADSRILYVQPNNIVATDRGNYGMDPQIPFATVQAAIDSLAGRDYHGDVIFVGANDAWAYGGGVPSWFTPIQESVTVDVSGLRIIGINPGLGVYWLPGAAGQFCITVQAMDTIIDGFAFMGGAGGGNGIYAEWAGGGSIWWADNLIVRNCLFHDDVDIAIQLEFVWHGLIEQCRFIQNDAYGIYVDPAGSGVSWMTIRDNMFDRVVTGAMALQNSDYAQIYRNSIYNAKAATLPAPLACTNEGVNLLGGLGNQVYDNYFSCLLPFGVGDYNDLNTAGAGDAWINNHCMNGDATSNPT